MYKKRLQKESPDLVSYNRMVASKRDSFMPLAIYLKTSGLADCTGISFIDSIPIRECDRKRIHQHKTFKDIARRGQCSLGDSMVLNFLLSLMTKVVSLI